MTFDWQLPPREAKDQLLTDEGVFLGDRADLNLRFSVWLFCTTTRGTLAFFIHLVIVASAFADCLKVILLAEGLSHMRFLLVAPSRTFFNKS